MTTASQEEINAKQQRVHVKRKLIEVAEMTAHPSADLFRAGIDPTAPENINNPGRLRGR